MQSGCINFTTPRSNGATIYLDDKDSAVCRVGNASAADCIHCPSSQPSQSVQCIANVRTDRLSRPSPHRHRCFPMASGADIPCARSGGRLPHRAAVPSSSTRSSTHSDDRIFLRRSRAPPKHSNYFSFIASAFPTSFDLSLNILSSYSLDGSLMQWPHGWMDGWRDADDGILFYFFALQVDLFIQGELAILKSVVCREGGKNGVSTRLD